MTSVKVYNLDGTAKEDLKLKDEVFAVKPNEDLLHQVIVGSLANQRGVFAHTKTKAEVRGGGKKPWRQKGTGRARHGSIRSPLWVGGGVTFGPRSNRNFKVKINKKIKNKALCMALTDKLTNSELIVVDKLEIKEPKTRLLDSAIKTVINKVNKELKGKALIVAKKVDKNLKLASRNIEKLEIINGKDLGALAVINNSYMVVDKGALQELEKRLS